MSDDILLKIVDFPIFKNYISFDVWQGNVIVLYGENGSGKTTFLRKIGLCGVFAYPQIMSFSSMAYLGHVFGVHTQQTSLDYLRLSLDILKISQDNIFYFLDRYEIDGYKKISDLSFGQIQKIGIVRVLLSKKQLWLLDEPFSNIDQKSEILFLSDLEKHLSLQGALICATHDKFPLAHEGVYL